MAKTDGRPDRFILADTDRLHRKITEMSERIRQLEDALSILQSSVAHEQHPLLARDLLRIKSSLELHSASAGSELARRMMEACEEEEEEEGAGSLGRSGPAMSGSEGRALLDAFGTLAVRDDGAAVFYGSSAGSEVSVSYSIYAV